jgi:hypothetical protein
MRTPHRPYRDHAGAIGMPAATPLARRFWPAPVRSRSRIEVVLLLPRPRGIRGYTRARYFLASGVEIARDH